MKILNIKGEWDEVPDDESVRYSKEDILEDCGISSRMFTVLLKDRIIVPKCFESETKHWFSDEDIAIINNHPKVLKAKKKTAPEKPVEVGSGELEVSKLLPEVDLLQQPVIIGIEAEKIHSTLDDIDDDIKILYERINALEHLLKDQQKLTTELISRIGKRFKKMEERFDANPS